MFSGRRAWDSAGRKTGVRPKPMVEIGGKPILWRIMQGYAHHGFDEFYVACGYLAKSSSSTLDYHRLRGNVSVDLRSGTVDVASSGDEQWQVHLVDTGQDTMTGGRVLRLRESCRTAPSWSPTATGWGTSISLLCWPFIANKASSPR
ncbi:MAG: hypothetical protein R3B91_20010 [Planctomycetaceae bacterium]